MSYRQPVNEATLPTDDFITEIFKPAPGWEGIYEVNAAGHVRRIKPGRGAHVGRILRPVLSAGYPSVALWKSGKKTQVYVHRLVAAAFIGPCPNGMETNHRDGSKVNSCLANLEYGTHSYNMRHAFGSGLIRPRAKVTDAQVAEIRAIPHDVRQKDIALRFGIARSTVSQIRCHGRRKRS